MKYYLYYMKHITALYNNKQSHKKIMQIEPQIKFTTEKMSECKDPTPWLSERTKNIDNPIIRFHNEIIDFVQYVLPSAQEHENKKRIFQEYIIKILHRFKYLMMNNYSEIKAEMQVISPLFKQGIYLKKTEIQIFIIVPQIQEAKINEIIQKVTTNTNYKFCAMTYDRKLQEYRVIIQHMPSQTFLWVNFVKVQWKNYLNDIGQIFAQTLELKYLFLINYCMVRQRGLHHNIRSMLIAGLCSFFMFERRRQIVRTLSENFIKFLEYFGVGLGHQRTIAYQGQHNYQCITSPQQKNFKFLISNSLDISTTKVKDYFKVIQNRYRIISNYYYEPRTSIVAHLTNPCLGNFYY